MNDPTLSRRTLIGSTLFSSLGTGLMSESASAQTQTQTQTHPADRSLSGTPEAPVTISAPPEPAGLLSSEVMELWPSGRIPGSQGVHVERRVIERGSPTRHDRAVLHVSRPILEVFRPQKPNGAAMIILPGGGYVRLAIDKEGAGGARRLVQDGITCFVLNYRLPGDQWAAGYDAAAQDVQRAVRLIRAQSARFGVDGKRIGVMGFSAGGHLAATSLTRYDERLYEQIDVADLESARPDVVMLGYAVLSVNDLSGTTNVPEILSKPLDQLVRKGLAPTFILHAGDDETVPVRNSLSMYQALKAVGVPVELHLYQEGGHGFGFNLAPEVPASHWPDLFVNWLRRSAFIA